MNSSPQTIKQIIREGERLTGWPLEMILSQYRGQNCCRARDLICHALRESCGLTFNEIGQVFGRNHGTVLVACCRAKENIERDELAASIADKLKEFAENLNHQSHG